MSLTDWTERGSDALRSIGDAAGNLVNPTVRLGVTGLSQAGKSVFITALVQNLIDGGSLPFLTAVAEARVKSAFLEPQPDDTLPRFPYERHVEAISGSPASWPESTKHISQLRLTLEYETRSFIWRQFGTSRLHIDIIDYPGEWLLDLPLLQMTYAEWSASAVAGTERADRPGLANTFTAFLNDLDPTQEHDERVAEEGARLFTDYLKRRREADHGLAVIGPGRFLMPGDLSGSPAITFFPLPEVTDSPAPTTLAANMERRFNAYREQVVRPFYRNHFARLDRQIVLVDALAAINSGPAAMRDLRDNLASVLSSFRPGARSWLSSILSRPIDRVLFAATKADHLHSDNHKRLEEILQQLIAAAFDRASAADANIKTMAIAAVRATHEGEVEKAGETYPVIIATPQAGEEIGGKTFDGKTETAIFSGDLPTDIDALFKDAVDPSPGKTEERPEKDIYFARLQPNERQAHTGPHPHIRLDHALDFLIGDYLT